MHFLTISMLLCMIFLIFVDLSVGGKTVVTKLCTNEEKRKIIKDACEHFRRKRAYNYSSGKNSLESSNTHQVIRNYTSGIILLEKRGKLEYCCVHDGLCKKIFTCSR